MMTHFVPLLHFVMHFYTDWGLEVLSQIIYTILPQQTKTDQKLLINFWLIKDRLRKKIQTYPLSELSVLVAGPLEMWGCGWSDVTLVYVTTHITFFGLKPEKSKMYSWKGEKLLSGYLIERKKSIHRQSYSACQLTISLEKDFSSV